MGRKGGHRSSREGGLRYRLCREGRWALTSPLVGGGWVQMLHHRWVDVLKRMSGGDGEHELRESNNALLIYCLSQYLCYVTSKNRPGGLRVHTLQHYLTYA